MAAKLLAVFVVAYALSPIDLIPDFIPVLGYLDDLLLLPGLIWLAIRMLPPDVLLQCRNQADVFVATGVGKPISVFGAALTISIWAAAAWWRASSSVSGKTTFSVAGLAGVNVAGSEGHGLGSFCCLSLSLDD